MIATETENILDVLDMCTRVQEIIINIALSDEPWEDIREYKRLVYTKADHLISAGVPAEIVQYFVNLYINHIPYVEKILKYKNDCQ